MKKEYSENLLTLFFNCFINKFLELLLVKLNINSIFDEINFDLEFYVNAILY